jgi:hypothetical protein
VVVTRYVADVQTSLSRHEARSLISGYLKQQGFTYGTQRGEAVWRKGGGTFVAPQFIKAEAGDGTVRVEAWIAGYVVLPGVYGGEQGLTGGYGWAVKSALRRRVEELEARLTGRFVEAAPTPDGARGHTGAPSAPARPAKPPGWYRDPVEKHGWRYWNGARWTTDTSDDDYAPEVHVLPPAE